MNNTFINERRKVISLRACAISLYYCFAIAPLSTSAIADDSGIYAGIFLGTIKAEEQQFSSSEQSFGIDLGYTFNRYFQAELSLFDLGDHSSIGMEGTGINLSAVASYPFSNNFSAFASIGGMMLDLDIDEASTTRSESGETTLQDGRDTSFLFGYGIEYRIKNWSFIAKNILADTDADIDILTVGARYHF